MKIYAKQYYPLAISNNNEYVFICESESQQIKQKVCFKNKFDDLFELELLVYIDNLDRYAINTKIRHKNSLKVLYTIFVTMIHFSKKTNNNIYVSCYTKIHSRLFSIYISRFFKEISFFYIIYKVNDENYFMPFLKNEKSNKFIFWKKTNCNSAEKKIENFHD